MVKRSLEEGERKGVLKESKKKRGMEEGEKRRDVVERKERQEEIRKKGLTVLLCCVFKVFIFLTNVFSPFLLTVLISSPLILLTSYFPFLFFISLVSLFSLPCFHSFSPFTIVFSSYSFSPLAPFLQCTSFHIPSSFSRGFQHSCTFRKFLVLSSYFYFSISSISFLY